MNAGSDWYPPIAKRAIRVGQSPPAKGHRKSCTDCEKLVASAKHGTTPTSSPTSSDEASCMVHCGLQKQSSISRPTRPSVNRASNIAESVKRTPLAFPGFKTCVQAKLRINSPDDAYEREADRMSEHVTSGPGHSIAAKPVPISRIGMVQRASPAGEPVPIAKTIPKMNTCNASHRQPPRQMTACLPSSTKPCVRRGSRSMV